MMMALTPLHSIRRVDGSMDYGSMFDAGPKPMMDHSNMLPKYTPPLHPPPNTITITTPQSGDLIVVEGVTTRLRLPLRRGDIVAFRPPPALKVRKGGKGRKGQNVWRIGVEFPCVCLCLY